MSKLISEDCLSEKKLNEIKKEIKYLKKISIAEETENIQGKLPLQLN